ncbi:Hpt domain-containing protein [Hyphomicrobium sp. D-2]|uniref:Hpt domain-containing protein n=1 Tax=Hyphomicrobium sp. D-2 TaxID=3041621 RepID=UPI002455EE46|nr:Hpt domain-containing protein [Hyphomicrobium sp. D-2]MDH4981439.1 Hpt domain-containing protein [Hyphomicrobium sp. D-2]
MPSPRIGIPAETPAAALSAADADQPVDLGHLRRFTHGDAALEAEILALFSDQLPVTIRALKDATSIKDWNIAAHTLKGSARAVGAWSLANAAEEAENLTQFSNVLERAVFVSKIEQVSKVTRKYIGSVSGGA